MRKRSLAVLLAALLLLVCAVPSFALVDRSDSFYVADYADVLSDELENRIIALNGELEYYCSGSQLVVVSVDYLDGLYSDEYAMTLFNEWGVGNRDRNNGTLLLLCPNENKAWLTYGSGLEGALTSSRVDEMFDTVFWDPFDAGDYETAVGSMVSELTAFYASYYNISADMLDPSSYQGGGYDYDDGGYVPDEPYGNNDYSYSSGSRLRPLVFLLIVVLIIYLLIRRADRRSYQSYCGAMGYGIRPYHWWYLFWGPHLSWHDPRPPRPPRPPMSGGYYSSWNHGSHQYGSHSSGGFSSHSSGSSFGGHSSGSSFGGHSGGFSSHSGGGFGGGGHGGGGGGRR